MQIDQETLTDLSIFHADDSRSVFHKMDHTETDAGRFWLRRFFSQPYDDLDKIRQTQQLLQLMIGHKDAWPKLITNGTIMVMEKFYETAIDDMPRNPDPLSALSYKLLHGPDLSIIRYTIGHAIDLMKGLRQTTALFTKDERPALLSDICDKIDHLLQKDAIQEMMRVNDKNDLRRTEVLRWGYFLRNRYKQQLLELIDLYGKLDAYHSMALAMLTHDLHFPSFVETDKPLLHASQLFHILLPVPVPYDLVMDGSSNFIFLTGANMAGKSTFIKAVGVAVYLAHLGIGVPAQHMSLGLFHGLVSNIQVNDDISKGESYFYNEVQRIKHTILKINDGNNWLVLIDELFKGTNVQDAMKCSSAVVKGLVRLQHSLFILSTHLYEIGEELRQYPNIAFRFFETAVDDDRLTFSYQLKEGISNDRLGYLILKREKVVDLLDRL